MHSLAVSLSFLVLAPLAASGASGTITFEKHIRPILKAQCFHCHGEEGEVKGGLDVRLTRFLLKGGDEGPAIVPGKAAESHLLKMVQSGEMPKGKSKLKATEIALIEQWIAQGAKTIRPEPETLGPEHAFTDEERAWWSIQPIQRPKVPAVKVAITNPIDAFIADKQAANQLSFSPEADPVTLIRRLSFDLTGLPPTPEEAQAFVAAYVKAPQQAYDEAITRLLASPAYGERWGRHWLDIAGYADSDGYTDKDLERKWAYKYRDYVINSLNKDKPFDQFVREQIAGDEMVPQPHKNLSAEAIEKITATGFLRMAADGTGAMNDKVAQNSTIADTIKIVSTAFYGMTIGCAQCHDHRYDPISQADYYRLRAVFEPGFNTTKWRVPNGRLVSLLTDEERAAGDKIEVEAKKLDAARAAKTEEFITEVLEKEVAKAEEKDRESLRTAYRTEVKKRTPEHLALLKKYPRVAKLSSGSLYLYDTTYKTKHADTLKKMAEEAAAVRATKPKEEFLQAFDELPLKPELVPATFVFHRGDIEQPKDKVKPGDLTVLAGQREIEVPEKASNLPTTGRRLAFANSLTDGKHPLLARVIVNQVWKRHFGKGIVNTPDDFGQLGERPSHPELLDWLASEFMRQGWSLKKLHHLILSSTTYRQSSLRDAERERIDPDNRLLSRMNVLRLEAETLRDSFLAVSGKLNPKLGGQPVPVTFNEEGQIVIGIDTRDAAGRQTGKFVTLEGEEYRRSIYVQARRSTPLEMFATFDAPAMTDPNCASRPVTTVSPQSLLLMNNGYMREHAQDLALRVQREAGPDLEKQVQRAWELSFSRSPSMSDQLEAMALVKAQTEHYKSHPAKLEHVAAAPEKKDADPALLGLAALCHALLSSNAFLYVD
ncbi:Planctomycete cytochrome C [Prosthecobacter debontii]|uniref:Planctomycete cytochrome C n=1 Tax=Prosthecobacter debontii TaxID=48467 RepID=A0A1T4YY00_9BACT|nr:PSD1 and planctomycete cytochrome C domain-containing protein [Prosthecobacter debontii]SKB06438.1 Planctomycete cytochrome C [Prosthecobacter debontii]